MNDGRPPREGAPRVPSVALRGAWQVIKNAVIACLRYRVSGLAAEAAFFTVLSMPPLIFGLAGTIGYVAGGLEPVQVNAIRHDVIHLSTYVVTPDVVDKVIEPTIDEVLSGGRVDVVSIGFVLALWSGSRALNVFIDAISVMQDLGGRRNFLVTRALSFLLYVLFLLAGVVLIPLVVAGPSLVDSLIPDQVEWLRQLYWPVVLLGSTIVLAILYRVALPARSRLCSELPGAVLALMIWVGGSAVLRFALDRSASTTTIYGPLTAPIALLIWLFVVSIAILIGAAFNAAIGKYWPWAAPASSRAPRVRRSPLLARIRHGSPRDAAPSDAADDTGSSDGADTGPDENAHDATPPSP